MYGRETISEIARLGISISRATVHYATLERIRRIIPALCLLIPGTGRIYIQWRLRVV